MRTRRNSFSVLERLVVVAIILATIAIVIPDLLRSKVARSVGAEFDQRSLRGESK
jgi:type II secretory pathway pseudopilin PulG